jgi:hypothetical protein
VPAVVASARVRWGVASHSASRALLVLVVAILSAACAAASSPGASAGSSVPSGSTGASSSISVPSAASPDASPPAPASPVVGVVTKVDSAGLDKVSGFTLRTNAGQTLVFTIGTLENGAQFPPGHLAEHLATGAPVRVSFRETGGQLVVYRIEDAG